jgi:hypothetical protein
MKRSRFLIALACCLAVAFAAEVRAGAPQPDTRQGDFLHICQGGPNKADACTVATEETDCPRSSCVVSAARTIVRGTLTLIAHDSVTDWLNGGATNRALTVMFEVRAPDGSKQVLAATYQNLALPTDPPRAPSEVVSIDMDENALRNLSSAIDGLLFAQPDSTIQQQLQAMFEVDGTPAVIGVQKSSQFADHTADGLATVLRFKVKIQFLAPA